MCKESCQVAAVDIFIKQNILNYNKLPGVLLFRLGCARHFRDETLDPYSGNITVKILQLGEN